MSYSLKPLDPFLSSGERGEGRGKRGGGEGRGKRGEGERRGERGEERGREEKGEGRRERGEGRGGAYFYTHTYIDLPYSTLITGGSVIQFLCVYSGPNKIIPRNCCRYYYIHCRYIYH